MTTYLDFVIFLFFWNLTPGPLVTLTARNSMKYGFKGGLSILCGILLCDTLYLTLAFFGVSEFITKHERIFYYAKMFGGIYILYIGVSIVLNASKDKGYELHSSSAKIPLLFKKHVMTGILTDLSDPFTIIGITSFILQFFRADMSPSETALFIITIPTLSIACFGMVILIFSNPVIRRLIIPKMVWFERISGCIITYMVITMFLSLY